MPGAGRPSRPRWPFRAEITAGPGPREGRGAWHAACNAAGAMSDQTDQTKHLLDLLSSFRIGMLVVPTAEGIMSARPMAVSERQGLEFWFMTSRQTGLVDAL